MHSGAAEASTTVVPFAGLIPVPWRNGGGVTREVAVGSDPPWRLSIASLPGTSHFSRFPDQHRTLLVASPRAVVLDVDGVRHRIGSGQTLDFPGGAAVSASAPCGGGTAINLMVTRSAATGRLVVLTVAGAREVSMPGLRAILVLAGHVRLDDGPALGPLDVALLPSASAQLDGHATVVQVVVTASPQRPGTGAG